MASTNKTIHYELSQYTASDKPTYLVDYNGDMSKIDTGIYNAQSEATTNTTSIGTLSNLNTTEKTNLVGAINEVNTQVGTNTGNISTLNTSVSANTGNIGTMANLSTTDKTSLVNAVNEVNYNVGLFNLTNFTSVTPTLSTGTLNYGELKIATNGDGSIAKIYGSLSIARDGNDRCIITASTSLRPESNITINCLVNRWAGNNKNYGMFDLSIATDGTVTIDMYDGVTNQNVDVYVLPCLLFIKDFGDTPTPQ